MATVVDTARAEEPGARGRVLASALHLFSQKGYEGASIREIIEGAGVTRPVLYYYFENKEDLFRKLLEAQFDAVTERLREAYDAYDACRDRLRHFVCTVFGIVEENPEAVSLTLQVYFAAPLQGPPIDRTALMRRRFRIVQEIIQEGLDAGELSGGDAQSLTLVFLGVMDTHVMAKMHRPEIHLTPEVGTALVDFFFSGAENRGEPATNLKSPYRS